MRWADLISECHLRLGQDESSPTFFSDADLTMLMEAAIRRLHLHSRVTIRRESVALAAGTQEYDLPDDCGEILRVAYDGERIEPYSQVRLDADDIYWRRASGTPFMWYQDRLDKKFGLYPNPTVSTSYEPGSLEDGVIVTLGDVEDGLIVDTSVTLGGALPEDGVIALKITGNHAEIFYRALPRSADLDEYPDVPMWAAHYLIFSALADAFRIGLPDSDVARSMACAAIAANLEDRVRVRVANVIPKVWNRGSSKHRKPGLLSRYPTTIEDA